MLDEPLAGDVAGFIAGEEQRGVGYVLDRAQAPHGNRGGHGAHILLTQAYEALGENIPG